MSAKKIVPAMLLEAVILIGGAVIAAGVIGNIPVLRDWIKKQWGGAPNPAAPWE